MATKPTVTGGVVVRYYIDGETTASIEYEPGLAAGTGFSDKASPWGNEWIGKGAKDGAWYNNIRIPFQKSVVVTVMHRTGSYGGFYTIVRGGLNVGVTIGSLLLPSNLRLHLFRTQQVFQPLHYDSYITLATLPQGTSGYVFLHTIAVASGNENFLEGCYHFYDGAQGIYNYMCL